MNQSTVIFAYLAAAFVIFITVRGELRAYMGFLLSTANAAPGGPASPASPTSSPQASGPSKADIAKTAMELAPYVL